MRFLSPAVMLTAFALPLLAQDPPSTEPRKHTIGFGVTLSPTALFADEEAGLIPLGLGDILVPMRVSPQFTIEAMFGVLRFSESRGGSNGIPLETSSFSNSRLGVGLLGDLGASAALKPYIGVRIVKQNVSSEFTSGSSTQSSKSSGWMFAGVVGGQHFFTDAFSFGGEIQLARTTFGEPEVSGGGGFPTGGSERSVFGTNGLVTIRWFP